MQIFSNRIRINENWRSIRYTSDYISNSTRFRFYYWNTYNETELIFHLFHFETLYNFLRISFFLFLFLSSMYIHAWQGTWVSWFFTEAHRTCELYRIQLTVTESGTGRVVDKFFKNEPDERWNHGYKHLAPYKFAKENRIISLTMWDKTKFLIAYKLRFIYSYVSYLIPNLLKKKK